jgi:next-to-BRCA1 protein 1
LPCTNDARFVEDLTVPDGTVVAPGVALDKRWSVLNAGSCDWSAGYRLVRVGTSAIEGLAELALFPASAGATAEWQVEVRAPSEPGEYLARWRARAPDGTLFGEEVYLLIFVEEATAVPSVSPSATP